MRRLLLVLAIAVTGCGGNSPTAPPAPPPTTLPTMSAIVVTASPETIIAETCTPALCGNTGEYDYRAVTTITVRETAGLAANVDFINVTFRSTSSNQEFGTISFNPNDITSRSGSNHLPALGSIVIPRIGGIYRLGTRGREITYTIAVRVIDANGNRLNGVITVRVV